jgi:hypothetical protein
MSGESKATELLQKRFDAFIAQTGAKPNADQIDAQIRAIMPMYDLTISNFYRLHAYFIDQYLKQKTEPEYQFPEEESPPVEPPKKKGFFG